MRSHYSKSEIHNSEVFPFFFFLNSFAGFDAVTLANNHINDFSAEGVNFTVETIEKAKIKHFGDSYGEWNSSQVIYDIYGAIFKTKVLSLLKD